MTPESLTKGKEYLEQAIALAYAGMAESYFLSAYWGFMILKEALPKAKSAAMEAVSRDDMLAEVRSMLGGILGTSDFDWAGAESTRSRGCPRTRSGPKDPG